jgi:ribosomal protein S18 acetylase RimI-like enzyme
LHRAIDGSPPSLACGGGGFKSCCRIVTIPPTPLTYRTIDLDTDAAVVVTHQRDACVATFGDDRRHQGDRRYLAWLKRKLEEFPDGFVIAMQGDRIVGQLELEAPYGSPVGYVNLFYLRSEFRGRGLGRALQEYAERYFRAWEAARIELHVSPTNARALGFYRRMGYRVRRASEGGEALWLMEKSHATSQAPR